MEHRDSAGPRSRGAVTLGELPLLLVLAVVAVGLVTAGARHNWRFGSAVVGLGLMLAAALRLALPARQAGLLVVRSRPLDAAVLLVLGFALVTLAESIPTS